MPEIPALPDDAPTPGLGAEPALPPVPDVPKVPTEEKVARADYVLDNGGTKEDLRIRALALLDLLRARARQEME